VDFPVESFEFCRPDTKFRHDAFDYTDAYIISDFKLTFEDDERSCNDILHQVLRTKRNRETSDSGTGDETGDVDSELTKHCQQHDDSKYVTNRILEQLQQRLVLSLRQVVLFIDFPDRKET